MTVQPNIEDLGAEAYGGERGASAQFHTSLVELWQIAKIRSRVIFGTAAAIFAIVVIVLFSITPLYTGTAVVMLDPRQQNVVNVQSVLPGLSGDQTTILTQVQILQSEGLASRVIAKLKLDQDAEFDSSLRPTLRNYFSWLNIRQWISRSTDILTPAQKAAQQHQRVLTAFQKHLTVAQVGLSSAIKISFDSESPGKAANISNAVADAYVEDQLNAKFEATQRANTWLSGRLGQLANQAAAAQSLVEQYKAQHRLTEVAGPTGSGSISVLDQQIAQENAQLMTAQTTRGQAEATAARVKQLVDSGHADEVNQVVSSPLIAQLRGQEAQLVQQLAQLSSRYGAEHPKMLDLQAEKRDLDAKIAAEITKVVATAENDAVVARAHEAVLNTALNKLEGQSSVQGQDRVKLAELDANANSARALYDAFVARSKQTQEEEGLQIPDARVISQASVPLVPSSPQKNLILGGGLVFALLIGFGAAFTLERLDNGFRIASRVEEVLGYPVFATLPNVATPPSKNGLSSAADLIVDRPLSGFAEGIRGLQMGISLSNVDKSPRVILVTSALPGEGKTTTALSLARHLAQVGNKVVVIDGDLRRPNIRNLVPPGDNEIDLIEVLRGAATLDQAIRPDIKGTAFILPVSHHVKNAPDLIESQAMAKTIEYLRGAFDYIVIDSAPILPVNDTKVLAQLVDAIVFVVRWEQTPRTAALDAIKALREVRAPIAGVALSRADTKRFHYYSFGYGSSYYAYSNYYNDKADV